MTCEQAMELLSPWLDGELDPQLREALEAHLEDCPDCRALADTLRGLDEKLSELREPAPRSLKQGVLYKIDQATGKAKKPRSRWFGPGAAIGAVAAALVLLVGLGVIPLRSRGAMTDVLPAADNYDLIATELPATAAGGLEPGEAYWENWEAPADTVAAPDGDSAIVFPGANGQHLAADTRAPEAAYNGTESVEDGVDSRSGGAKGEDEPAPAEPAPVTDGVREACAALSGEEEALVLVYTEFDFKSLFGVLEAEEPELFSLVEGLEPEERDGMLVFETDCGTALAIHEWLLERLPVSAITDAKTSEAEKKLQIRMEELDPGSGSLYKVISWASPSRTVAWPAEWPEDWADRVRTAENWELFFPDEDYSPNAEKPACLVFAN